ncbi:MAG: hypothetical protein NTY07_01785 [Bacteroidia bacterium]|nr:hypothetical protein [Bacteroidia bacterium]
MENISATVALKNAIQRLEVEQAISGQLLKEQFYFTYESLKPVNILRSTFHEVVTSPHLIDDILGTAVGLATGFVSKKIVMVGASGNLIRKLFGAVLQLGVTTVVSQHPETIKSIGQFIYQRILRKKEKVLPRINESGF